MIVFRMLRKAAVALAVGGMLFPQTDVLAATPGPLPAEQAAPAMPEVVDVALSAGGTLVGRVIDEQGQPVDGALVSFRQGDHEVASIVSAQDGTFSADNLRAGVYVVQAGQGEGVFRFWAPNTAPPSARQDAVIVSGTQVVRGQFGHGGGNLLLLGVAITGVVLSGVALHEIRQTKREVRRISP